MFALSLLPLITLVKTVEPNLIRLSLPALQFFWRLFPGLGGGIKGGD